MAKLKFCAYCGNVVRAEKAGQSLPPANKLTFDHVFPSAIFPQSMLQSVAGQSGINLITVPACRRCNLSFSDDEVCFQNMLPLCSTGNAEATELHNKAMVRLTSQPDSRKRADQLADYLKYWVEDGKVRMVAYPGRDPKCLRIIKKIIRGLCFKHSLNWPIEEERVWASVYPYEVPPAFMPRFQLSGQITKIVQYGYNLADVPLAHSFWYFKFLERAVFVGGVNTGRRPFYRPLKDIFEEEIEAVRMRHRV